MPAPSKPRASGQESFRSLRAISRWSRRAPTNYCSRAGAALVRFGVDILDAVVAIAEAAKAVGVEPDEV
jgi:hypothetical protein